jgi:RNA polymerase II-associated protein 2
VYGLERGSVEELLIANGRECPEKTVLKDGLSLEIRRALDSCVCNAVPVLISNLRLQIPVSKLEITLVRVNFTKQIIISYLFKNKAAIGLA